MIIKKISETSSQRQDGAIYKDFMFCFNSDGRCLVYTMSDVENPQLAKLSPVSEFYLDTTKDIVPHSNAVTFGKEYYSSEDEFPLIYTNVYNNYMKSENQMKGTLCVYRLTRNGMEFKADLVQLIEVAFTDNSDLWCSADCNDVRPYGNFVADVEGGRLYAFTMKDQKHTTAYFSFDLPKVSDGIMDEKYGVNRVSLNVEDIKDYFECNYQNFMQGACYHNGKIYSVEGFTDSPKAPPHLRVIDTSLKKETETVDLIAYGLNIEPEMIDFL